MDRKRSRKFRWIRIFLWGLLLSAFLGQPVFSQSWEESFYEEQWGKSGAGEFIESLPPEAVDPLTQRGLSPKDGASLSAEGANSIWQHAGDALLENMREPFQVFLQVAGVLLLCGIPLALQPGGKKLHTPEAMEFLGALCGMLLFLAPVSLLIQNICETIRQGTGILLGGIPVLCGILTASGHTVAGSTFSVVTAAAGNVVTLLTTSFLVPVLHVFLAISSISNLYPRMRLQVLCASLLKALRWTLVFTVSLYSALLSMQSALSSSADAVTLKAARLSVSSFVPVVGGAVSDAFSVVQASMGVLRSGIGSFAILALLILFLPGFFSCTLWVASGCLLEGLCGMLEMNRMKGFFHSCRDVLQTLLAFQASFCMIAVTSFALVLSSGGTGA